MNISHQKGDSDQNLSVKGILWTKAFEWISRHGLVNWKHRFKTCYIVQQQGSGRPRSACYSDDNIEKAKDLVLSQEDKPKRIDQLMRFRVKLLFSVQMCTW